MQKRIPSQALWHCKRFMRSWVESLVIHRPYAGQIRTEISARGFYLVEVKLDHDEIAVCQLLGRMRSLIARSANVHDAKIGDQDGADADVIGLMAEFAFAKRFNCFPDLGLKPRSGSYDGRINGKRYDIKATKHKNGRLLCTMKDNPDVDIYVLAIVDQPVVRLVGYASKDELRHEGNLIDLGHGKGYAMTQDKLQQFRSSK